MAIDSSSAIHETKDECPRPWQFSLSGMLWLVTFAAVGCCAIKLIADYNLYPTELRGMFAAGVSLLALSVCGMIGVTRKRLKFWLSYALVLDCTIYGIAVFFPP